MPTLGSVLSDVAVATASGHSSVEAFRKMADQSTASIDYSDVTGFTATIAANEVAVFNFTLYWRTSLTTAGIGLAMNGPSPVTSIVYGVEIYDSATSPSVSVASGYDTGLVTARGLTGALLARVSGVIENGTNSGTLALRFRSSNPLATISITRGSNGLMVRI